MVKEEEIRNNSVENEEIGELSEEQIQKARQVYTTKAIARFKIYTVQSISLSKNEDDDVEKVPEEKEE